MKRQLCIVFPIIFFSFLFSACTHSAAPPAAVSEEVSVESVLEEISRSFIVSQSVIQGDILSIVLHDPACEIDKFSAELADSAGKSVLSFSGFRFLPDGSAVSGYWAALGGVSSTQAPGDYDLSIRLTDFTGQIGRAHV